MRYEFLSDNINDQLEVLDAANSRLKKWLAKQDSVASKSKQDEMLATFFREEWVKRFGSPPSEEETKDRLRLLILILSQLLIALTLLLLTP